jgi:hypothetical protein
MKKKASSRRRRPKRPYSEKQLAGIRASTATRKQETIKRLRAAIESLKQKKQAITAQSIYTECGLHYSSFVRNEEAIALFRANSTQLTEKKKRTRRTLTTHDEAAPTRRDPLLNYKKPQLVTRLREAQQQIQVLEQQLATVAEACLQREAQVTELKAKLAGIEPYRDFVEKMRLRIQNEEHDGQAHE